MEQNIKIATEKKLRQELVVKKAKLTLEQAEFDLKVLDFELEFLKRTGKIEEIFWRFPHIGRKIFEKISDAYVKECKTVNKWWGNFIDEQKMLLLRLLRNHICFPLLKKLQQYDLKILHRLAKHVHFYYVKHALLIGTKYVPVCHNNSKCKEFNILGLIISKSHEEDLELSKIMIENMTIKNPKDREGNSLLHRAARNRQEPLEILKYMIENIDDKNPKDQKQRTPLHEAAFWGHLELYKLIIEHIDEKYPKDRDGRTPLHDAAKSGHFEITKLITKTTKNVDLRDNYGATPLHEAANGSRITAFSNHYQVFQFLIERAENKNPMNNNRSTPLHIAAKEGSFQICKLIIQYIDDVNPVNDQGRECK